ncbi:MAG: hypothetical protein QOF37_1108 [Thermoleophilaceae bacterium]|nr:hypothetical protein [Thermoleophilaceae bacterium]
MRSSIRARGFSVPVTVTDPPTTAPGTRSADVRLDRAFSLAGDPAIKVLTLDVFDTMLWRRVVDPVDVFPIVGALLQERGMLLDTIPPHGFSKLRRSAEQRARNARGGGSPGGVEVTLDEIYAQIPPGVFNDAPPDGPIGVEIEVERRLLGPDLDVVQLVRAARADGKRVAAVSDTYFSEETLRSFLHPHFSGDAAVDHVFASSEHRTGKGGDLFPVALRELGVRAAEVVHVGDSEAADVEGARRHGIRAIWFERRPKELDRLLERERHYLDPEYAGRGGDFGLTATRAKVLHRRELAELPDELKPFWRYGAIALGPALAGFAEWVQERTRQVRGSTALCLMREGELLAQLVSSAGQYIGGADAEPLWLSRQVCARAAIFEGRPEELQALLSRRSAPLVRELCATLGVEVDASPVLARNADTRMNEHDVATEVIDELTSNPELRGKIVARSRLLRERVLAYVAKMLPEGESNMTVVDLGWGGTIQKLLQQILHESGSDIHLIGLYLLTQEVATERILDGLNIGGYLAAQGVPGAAARAIMRSPEILEQVCMPDVGSQLDLDSDLEPVLDEAVDRNLVQSAERAAVQKGIRAFQREWVRYAQLDAGTARLSHPDARRILLAQVARATVAPTAAEAAVFGGWVHDENFGSRGFESIVGDDHFRRALRHMDPETLLETPMSDVYWPFGLAGLEDEHLAKSAEAVAMGLLPASAFYSALESGDLEVYFDNGYGFSADWRKRVEGRRNRFGLSYARAELRGDEVRAVRIDPVRAQCLLRIDWIAMTCWVRGEPEPRRLVFDTHEALARFTMRGLTPGRAKFYMAGGNDPQMELDLRAELGGATAYEVVVEVAYAVMLIDPRGEDEAAARELQRRMERRSRATKRFVRQLENRTGMPIGEPLRKAYRKLAARLRS